MLSLVQEMGVSMKSFLRLDASAALGILQRKGVGKIRHLGVGCLWLREKEARGQIRLANESGETSPADIGTNHPSEEVMTRHLNRMSCAFREGRPDVNTRFLSSCAESRPSAPPTSSKPCASKISRGVWVAESEGAWTRRDKGVRALRGFQGCTEACVDLDKVIA